MPPRIFISEALASLGYTRSEIEESLGQARYDDVFATYLLLGRKTTDVSIRYIKINVQYIKNIEIIFPLHYFRISICYSLKVMDHGQVVHYRCVTFHLKSVQVVEEEAVEGQVVQYRVHLTEVFTEVFLLVIQNPVDGPRLVVKLFVSVIFICFNHNS